MEQDDVTHDRPGAGARRHPRAGFNPDRGQTLIERYRAARRDPALVVIEGLHALKHAVRFGADIVEIVAEDPASAARLADQIAPDAAGVVRELARPVLPDEFVRLTPAPVHTALIALARRPAQALRDALHDPRPTPVVHLEEPANTYNLGAVVRVAAAANAAALLVTGRHDPWNPGSVRAGAGLQFALPCARIDALPANDRPLVAIDPDGDEIAPSAIPLRAILAFGTERHGLTPDLLATADLRVRIPMRPGVSSLNLATAVAAMMYGVRWAVRLPT